MRPRESLWMIASPHSTARTDGPHRGHARVSVINRQTASDDAGSVLPIVSRMLQHPTGKNGCGDRLAITATVHELGDSYHAAGRSGRAAL